MRIKFPSVTQIDSKDCGAACLKIISEHYGRTIDLYKIKKITGESKEGVSVYDMQKAAEKMGFNAIAFENSYQWVHEKTPMPCIIHWKNSHFLVVYKVKKNKVYVSDPAIGSTYKLSKSEFTQGWLGHIKDKAAWKKGIVICLEPSRDFYKNVSEKESFLQVLKFLWDGVKHHKGDLIKIIVISLLITLTSSFVPFLTQSLIDYGIPSKDLNFITVLLVAHLTLMFFSASGDWVKQAINLHLATRMKINILSDFFSRLVQLPMSYFDRKIMGDILQRTFDYDRLEDFLLNSMFNILTSSLFLVVFSLILFSYNYVLFWIFVAGAFLYILWVIMFWNIRKKMDIRYFSVIARNHSHWMELFSNIQDVKTYNIDGEKKKQWQGIQMKLYKVGIKMLNINQVQGLGGTLINGVKDTGIIYFSAYLVLKGELTFGMLISVQYILSRLNQPLKDLIMFIQKWQMAYISYIRINEVYKVKSDMNNEFLPVTSLTGHLKINKLFFRYNNDAYILSRINAIIPEGKVTSIIGESGCGKSTLLRLIAGLYAPNNGRILIGDKDLKFIDPVDWRNKFSMVTQESKLFRDSIINNIVLKDDYDEEHFQKVIKVVGLSNVIQKFSAGFFTYVGEDGRGLSSGEKQKVLLARALFKKDISYLFLDEATNNIDVEAEDILLINIKKAFPHLTIVFVSHRKENTEKADYIISMKEGTIIEEGFNDLLKNDYTDAIQLN